MEKIFSHASLCDVDVRIIIPIVNDWTNATMIAGFGILFPSQYCSVPAIITANNDSREFHFLDRTMRDNDDDDDGRNG